MHIVVGAGPMAQEYTKVLQALDVEFLVVGRSEESAKSFAGLTGAEVVSGGIDKFLSENSRDISSAIVCTGVEALFQVTSQLLDADCKNILVEKPAGMNYQEIKSLQQKASEKSANVMVAYNRRFYSSVVEAKKIIAADGGVTSFNFELTEWAHKIAPLQKAEGVKEAWFLANTTHVVDLAFFLGGKPVSMNAYVDSPLDWHPSGSNYSGAGRADKDALFSYSGNWQAPGRWAVEILTSSSRLIFKPMEELWLQKLGSIAQDKVAVDDSLDQQFKPGLYLQAEAFLQNNFESMCSIDEHLENSAHYVKMAGY